MTESPISVSTWNCYRNKETGQCATFAIKQVWILFFFLRLLFHVNEATGMFLIDLFPGLLRQMVISHYDVITPSLINTSIPVGPQTLSVSR